MLNNKSLSQESIIMMFFVVMFLGVTFYMIVDRGIMDVIFLLVLGYYFVKFLVLKYRR